MACLAVLQGRNEGEREQKEKNMREGFLKIFPSFCVADMLST